MLLSTTATTWCSWPQQTGARLFPALAGLWALLEEGFDLGAVGAQCFRVVTTDPGSEVGDDGWGAAEHGDSGTERQSSEPVGWQDRDAADGALVRAGAVIADGGGVGVFVALTDQRREVLKITGVGCAAEDDFHDRGIPDRVCCVLTPLIACLRQRLEHRHRGDAGAATFGHEGRQRRERCEVPDLIQCEQYWRRSGERRV